METAKEDEWKDSLESTSGRSTTSKRSEANRAQLLLCRREALLQRQAIEEKELKLRQEKECLEIETELRISQIVLETTSSNASTSSSDDKHESVKRWLGLYAEPAVAPAPKPALEPVPAPKPAPEPLPAPGAPTPTSHLGASYQAPDPTPTSHLGASYHAPDPTPTPHFGAHPIHRVMLLI